MTCLKDQRSSLAEAVSVARHGLPAGAACHRGASAGRRSALESRAASARWPGVLPDPLRWAWLGRRMATCVVQSCGGCAALAARWDQPGQSQRHI